MLRKIGIIAVLSLMVPALAAVPALAQVANFGHTPQRPIASTRQCPG